MSATGAAKPNQKANPLDDMMTGAQIARRKFKSGLPRKLRGQSLSIGGALGETFTLMDTFRGLSPMPDRTILAALAYYCEIEGASFVEHIVLPNTPKVGPFCDAVYELAEDNPKFLGVIFVHWDLETENPAYKMVSFGVPFIGGPEALGRLRAAQHSVFAVMLATPQSPPN